MSVHVNPAAEVKSLLREHKAVLIRTKKHLVYKFPNGRIYVEAATPSDVRAADNQLRDLRRVLGLNGERGAVGERRVPRVKPGRDGRHTITPSANTAMLEAMRKVGLTEDALKAKIATLTIELRAARQANGRKKRALHQMHVHCGACWGCWVSRWWALLSRAWLEGWRRSRWTRFSS